MASREPAPGALGVVEAFVNTTDLESETDELSDPGALRDWLVARELIGADERCARADLHRAVAVREALRRLLVRNAGDGDEHDADAVLDDAARRARYTIRFRDDGAHVEPTASGADGAIGRLLAIVTAAMADGTWERLKACRSDICQWAFYDHSRNGSAAWCDMAVCGSRQKMRAYRRRLRAPTAR